MKNKVIEEIVEANSWRDSDFSKFKVNPANVDEELWCRILIPMIYAHWEGYVVCSLRILLEYLNKLKLAPKDVQKGIVVISLADSYKKLSGKQSFKQRIEFTDSFEKLYHNHLTFSKRVNTKSNLKSDVLKELCGMFGFDFDKFKELASDIDRLVHVRNSIAHGENSILPDMANVENFINIVNKSTDILFNEICDFVKQERYLADFS